MRRAVCPGSFDPMTNGHLDIVARACALFDEVLVAVGVNVAKQRLFSAQERVEMVEQVCAAYPTVRVVRFDGLLTDFCRAHEAQAVVKGLRAGGDLDYELAMAQMNDRIGGVETVFVPTRAELSFVSSSLVKEVASLGGEVAGLVPDLVHRRLTQRFAPPG